MASHFLLTRGRIKGQPGTWFTVGKEGRREREREEDGEEQEMVRKTEIGEERETENREARKGRMKRSPGGGERKRNTHWEPLVTSQVLSYVQWQVPFPYGTIASSMIRTHEDEVRRA